jgi:Zn-dependent M28 family amino/carboxypeptidase
MRAVVAAAAACLICDSLTAAQGALRFDAAQLMRDVHALASPKFEGRRTGTSGNAHARAWIVERFRAAGLETLSGGFEMPFQFTHNSATATGVNVVGLCSGRGAADDAALIITAHFDHLGIVKGALYPGADDNASGVAALLALAEWCVRNRWSHDAVFVAFDAEESGLKGARAFVAAPPVARQRLALNVNLDMLSRSAKRELYIAGTHHYPALERVLQPVVARASVNVLFGHDRPNPVGGSADDWTMLSDHGAFHAAGVPFVYFGVEDHPDYHKPTDTPDKIDPEFFRRVVDTVLDAVTALDRAIPLRRQ